MEPESETDVVELEAAARRDVGYGTIEGVCCGDGRVRGC